jgi:uncharacterized membrane protein
VTLSHGRTRKRYAERAALIVIVAATALLFFAWALGLALLILIVTNQ